MTPTPGAAWRMLRPLQWSKNLLVLAALLFARQAGEPEQIRRAVTMFVAFCLVSSGLYILNDLLDREADRKHPRKKSRPIASGAVSRQFAGLAAPVLVAAGLLLGSGIAPGSTACLMGYAGLSTGYSGWLKRLVIVDILAIATGFVLRAAAGAYAISVEISPWLLMCTFLLALFLATAKRRHELVTHGPGRAHRSALGEYTVPLLDQMLAVLTACTLSAYVLYAFSEQTARKFPSHLMPLTTVFVVYGVFRYLFLVHKHGEGGEPEVLLATDRALQITLILYVATVALALR